MKSLSGSWALNVKSYPTLAILASIACFSDLVEDITTTDEERQIEKEQQEYPLVVGSKQS